MKAGISMKGVSDIKEKEERPSAPNTIVSVIIFLRFAASGALFSS